MVDVIFTQDIFPSLEKDFYEPHAVNLVLNHNYTTFNIMSQGS